MSTDNIFALSTGSLPSGVAVVRVSGSSLSDHLSEFIMGPYPETGRIALRTIIDPADGTEIDSGLVSSFLAPKSFTGEDCFEFHVHGGPAVVDRLLQSLGNLDGFRLAEAGEFSKRAFENGKLDLTEAEGLSDLLAAETESQRKLAVSQAGGVLREIMEDWRSQLVRCRAFIEAELDFADEDDVPGSASNQVWSDVAGLACQIEKFYDDGNKGEIIRRGVKIALMGKPNAGKSSLLNALAKRDIAIVTDEAGTTRDVLEVNLDIDGYQVVLFDTAGIRLSDSKVEVEGIKRAVAVGEDADLVLWLNDSSLMLDKSLVPAKAQVLQSKSDSVAEEVGLLSCSVLSDGGLDALLAYLSDWLSKNLSVTESVNITRLRHRQELEHTLIHLHSSLVRDKDITMRSEDLRLAGDCLGRITGRIDVEDLLDLIFSEFCIGK